MGGVIKAARDFLESIDLAAKYGEREVDIVKVGLVRALLEETLAANGGGIPMLLTCPSCGERHIDEAEFATRQHHTHACQHCGMVWRPSLEPTFGVRFLPGFKNAETST